MLYKNVYKFDINKKGLISERPFYLVVIPPRLERGTHSLEGCCSIQLSYGTLKIGSKGIKKTS